MLRGIFGPMRNEVSWERRKLVSQNCLSCFVCSYVYIYLHMFTHIGHMNSKELKTKHAKIFVV